MIEYVTEIEIAASLQSVWRRLTAFSDYPAWNPFQTIEGQAARGARVRISTRWAGRANTATARITGWEVEKRLEFLSGWIGFKSRRWYQLEPTPNGVRVKHGVAFSGFAAELAFRDKFKIERLRPHYQALSVALASSDKPSGHKSVPEGTGNRRQRRAARRARPTPPG